MNTNNGINISEDQEFQRDRELLRCRGYICRSRLGRGAFSRVYSVETKSEQKICACKISRHYRLLEREAEIMAGLQHPLFPGFLGLWQEAEEGLLLMEYVPGENMEEMLKRRGGFCVTQAIRIGMELAEGLWYLQERSQPLIFRDVKPANCVIRQDGRVKLLDFGCVCLMGEKAASLAGTPGFAAPEQLTEEGNLSAACDVYGWGQTVKGMLGLAHKHKKRKNGNIYIERSMSRKRRELLRILDACTKREPSCRIPDMRGVMAAMMRLCEEKEGCGGFLKEENAFLHREILCRKNIVILGKNS